MSIKLITPQMKDLALAYLLSEKLELLTIESTNDGTTVTISAKAYDMHTHGGFTAQEELLKANINKLGYELDVLSKKLEPELLETANKISSIAMAVLSALPLFKS